MRFKKYLKTSVLVIIFLLSQPKVNADWWNSSWGAYKNVTFTEQSGNDLTNYPVEYWFPHNGKAQADCDDVRVLDETETEVEFNVTDCNSTHVKLTHKINISASSSVDYQVYYDNPDGGQSTKEISYNDARYNVYDNFNDGTVAANWQCDDYSYADGDTHASVSESGDEIQFGDDDICVWDGFNAMYVNVTARMEGTSGEGANNGPQVLGQAKDITGGCVANGNCKYYAGGLNIDNNQVWLKRYNATGRSGLNSTSQTHSLNTFYWEELLIDENNKIKMTDITNSKTVTYDISAQTFPNSQVGLGDWADGNAHFDVFMASVYVKNEPTVSVGSEQTPNQPPTYSNFNVESPSTYNPTAITNISINWSDPEGNFESSILETNISGTPSNHSGNITSASFNLGAGTYYAKFYGNDTKGKWNLTNRKNFTINKALASLLINKNTTSPITYPESVKTIGSNCPSQLTCSLYRNGSPVSNPDEVLLGAGNYKWSFNTSGNKNYTQEEVVTKLTVNKGVPSLSILFNKTSPITYPTPLKTTAFERNQGDSDLTYILERNGTLIEKSSNVSDETLLKPGVYNYTYYTKGGNNWTSEKTGRILVVKKGKKLEKEKINFLEKSLTSGRHIIKILRKIGEEIKKIFTPEKIGLEKRTPNYSFKTYTYNNFTVKKLRGEGIELELRESSDKKEINFKCPEGIYVRKIIKGNIKERIKGDSREVRLKFERAMNILKENSPN